ncbi:MAG: hypothetical protein JKY65_02080 [Planctomycetes bacterium]|nr:hypothetical protein [Planctomycetota bacterium]
MSDQERVLTTDMFGLRGLFRGGWSIEHLPIGTVFTIGKNEKGKTSLFARGRQFPLDTSLKNQALASSRVVRS